MELALDSVPGSTLRTVFREEPRVLPAAERAFERIVNVADHMHGIFSRLAGTDRQNELQDDTYQVFRKHSLRIQM